MKDIAKTLKLLESKLTEFNNFSNGGDNNGEDPYRYPKPTYYQHSKDFFEQFDSDYFDKEDFNDSTGEFKGYWGDKGGKLTQIAYFKFQSPAKVGSEDPGMGWHYEPQDMWEGKEENTMENLNLQSLKYLAGVKETIAECGMGPTGSNTPASINITAGSGQELTGMLKDIMNLAGVHKVEPHHMPLDTPDAGPSAIVSAPPAAGAMVPDMHKLMAMVDGVESDTDSMNAGEMDGEGDEKETKEDYDNSPDTSIQPDPLTQFGDINSGDHRERQKGLPVAKPVEETINSLYAEYQKFISESTDVTNYKPKSQGGTRKELLAKYKKTQSPKDAEAARKAGATQKELAQCKTDKVAKEGFGDVAKKVGGALKKVGAKALDTLGHGSDEDLLKDLQKKSGVPAGSRHGKPSMASTNTKESKESKSKPSAGMTKKEKTAVVKKAKAGKDIGKPGKGFEKVEKAAAKGGAKNPKAVAAAAMWKSQAKK